MTPKILVVDDDAALAEMLTIVLRGEGFETDTVGDGVQGGEYWGPAGWFQLTGPPALVRVKPHARDRAAAEALWALSARATSLDPVPS